MKQWMDERMNKWLNDDECMDEWMNGTDEWIFRERDGWMDG